MTPTQHPVATEHLPMFVTAPGNTDVLMVVTGIILFGAILAAGVFFFWLHSLPERMVHNKIQFDIVAVLALLSLFTHIHAFWVVALIIALIDFPDFSLPRFSNTLDSMASSLEKLAGATSGANSGAGAGSAAHPAPKPVTPAGT